MAANEGSAPSGFTALANFILEGSGANWCGMSFSYKIVSATQSAVTLTPSSASGSYHAVVAAFTADGPAGPTQGTQQTAVTVIYG
jgi:hypothetical protein